MDYVAGAGAIVCYPGRYEGGVRIETHSGGAIPSYVTVHMDREDQLDELIGALSEARSRLRSV